MNSAEINKLEEIRLEVIKNLNIKYGIEKVQQVNNLSPQTVMRVLEGQIDAGVEDWMIEIIQDFENMILSHPNVILPQPN